MGKPLALRAKIRQVLRHADLSIEDFRVSHSASCSNQTLHNLVIAYRANADGRVSDSTGVQVQADQSFGRSLSV